MKAILLFFLSFISFMWGCPDGVFAAPDPVGTVVAVRGDAVAIGEDGVERSLALKSSVYLKDTLKTGDRGRLQVLFNDATIISVGPGSRMTVADYEWTGDGGKMENRVKEGFFHIMGGNIAKQSPEEFNTVTPIATIGIRGSTYAVRLIDDALSVVFIGGTGIHVFNELGGVEIDRPGFGTLLTQKLKKIQAPRKFSESELEGILKHTAPEKEEAPASKKSAPIPPKEEASTQLVFEDNLNLIKDIESEIAQNQQEEVVDEIESEESNTDSSTGTDESKKYIFSGHYMNMLIDPDENILSLNRYSKGTLNGTSRDGHVTGEGIKEDDSKFPIVFDMTAVDPDGDYAGSSIVNSNLKAFPLTDFSPDTDFDADRHESLLGEFVILNISKETVFHQQETLTYSMLGFLGIPADQSIRPLEGIYEYAGPAVGFSKRKEDDFYDGGMGSMKMWVNWQNNRFIGFIESEADDVHDKLGTPFFGTIDSDKPEVEEAIFLGSFDAIPLEEPKPGDPGDPLAGGVQEDIVPISWLTGSTTGFGGFYGSQYQGFGGLAQGSIVDIESDQKQPTGEWQLAGAAFREHETAEIIAPQGTVQLSGFVIGVGENMTDPNMEPRFFMNQSVSDFTMSIDKDAGEITGTLSAIDIASSANALSNVQIGGEFGSAFVDDDLYLSLLGGTGVVTSAGKTGDLKKYGNHLVPTGADEKLAEHTTWGYWEVAYEDPDREPGTQKPFHVHVPSSKWIAGQVTSEEKIRDLVQTAHVGEYHGKAMGVLTGPEQMHQLELDGSVHLDIDFSPSATAPISGDIQFVEQDIHLVIENGTLGPDGFSAHFQNTLESELNGAFFGPNAETAAGNFAAILEQETAITGIFGADAQ